MDAAGRPAISFRSHGTTLRRDDDLELYLVEHRRGRVLICPLIPHGLHEDVTDRIPRPRAGWHTPNRPRADHGNDRIARSLWEAP
ncbi:hypothetical protein [Streptomyces leeuwenhoekii]|uniref:hypothetical protein n=1 Tax=Streptomyces leeuwenhoekii TaxID=1437453 RepID=UPI0004941672|nr:hypothetical protein [Streptomyces leeuwenhoekii]